MKNKSDIHGRPGKVLAIDFGTRSVGLAVTDESRQVVFGRGVLRGWKSLEDLFDQVQALCEEERVKLIVFGLPYGESEEEKAAVERYRGFAEKLEERLRALSIPVVFSDESFSTFDGLSGDFGLEEEHLKAFRSSMEGHERAAIIILKRYLAGVEDEGV